MPIIISEHAQEQIKERKISRRRVEQTVENPDEISTSFKNRKLRRKQFDDMILEVVTTTEGSQITVITAYPLD